MDRADMHRGKRRATPPASAAAAAASSPAPSASQHRLAGAPTLAMRPPTSQLAAPRDTRGDDEDDEKAALLAEPFLRARASRTSAAMNVRQLGPQGVIVLLCCINLLNYVDRGIIPGAPEKFDTFISSTLGVSVLQQSVYFGLLQSAFIASYSVFSMVFGYLALSHRPFRLIAIGMGIWIVAVIICGIAQSADSYYVLIIGRVISGVGEASFQCTATPFINRHAPPARRALYLGIYLASITVGTAIGYIYGSLFANSGFGWAGAYYLEAIIMAVLVSTSFVCVPADLNQVPRDKVAEAEANDTPSQLTNDLLSTRSDGEAKMSGTAFLDADKTSRPFFAAWWEIFRNVPFMLVILGHAAYTFSLAALSTFSPAIFIGLGLFTSETTVSLLFGGLVAITGTIGTPIGGLLVDRIAKKGSQLTGRRCVVAVASLFYYMAAAEVLGLIMVSVAGQRAIFLVFLTGCLFCMCALSVPETVAVLELFPESQRAMAISANTMLIHALGDVPSPIILGALKDSWAPRCGTVEIDGEAHLNPECYKDRSGLKYVLLFAVLWLVWGVFLWGAALFVVRRRQKARARVLSNAVDA